MNRKHNVWVDAPPYTMAMVHTLWVDSWLRTLWYGQSAITPVLKALGKNNHVL